MDQETSPVNKKRNWFLRHKVLTALLAIIVIGGIIAAASSSKKTDNSQTPANTTPAAQSSASTSKTSGNTVPKIGTAVRDGKFEFVVSKVDCGKTEVVSPDSDILRKTAQGQYCVVTMSVKNIGNQQQGFFATNQKLLDTASKQYGADDVATAYAQPTSAQSTWAQINPGNSIDATIVFDLPKTVTAATAELHDSAFSGGAKVSLQ